MVTAVGVVAPGAVPVGHGLVHHVAVGLDVAGGAELGFVDGESESVLSGVCQKVARITFPLCRGRVEDFAHQLVAVTVRGDAPVHRPRGPIGHPLPAQTLARQEHQAGGQE